MEFSGTRIGTEIAGFRIESVLGRGGMSVVYLAEQTRLERKVALKVMASALGDNELFRNRFLQESRLAASLDHPNIIPIYDAGEENGCLYIAMRHVDGRDLSEVLAKDGPLSLGRTLFVLEQLAGALDAAHEHDLIHRDVKPANVLLVGETDRVYLTDFGVAKPTTSAGLTRTGFFIGTPDYSAPEQIEGRDVDQRTDVYALGGVFYSCLTGVSPYERETEVAVLQAHLLEPPPRLKDQRPDLPRALDRVIAKAMAKEKDDRYPTCGDFAAAAEAAAHDRSIAPIASTIASPAAAEPDMEGNLAETVLAADALAATAPTVPPATTQPVPSDAPVPPTPTPTSSAGAPEPQSPPTSQLTNGDAAGGGPDEPSAPPAQPPATKERRTFELTPGRMIMAGVAVLLLVGIAAAIGVLLSGGNSKGAAATNTSNANGSTTQTSTQTGITSPIAVGLHGVIPATLLQHCTIGAPVNGAAQTATCKAPTNTTAFWPDNWSFSLYPSTAAGLKAYNTLRVQNGIGRNYGRCNRTSWSGEGAWLHNPEGGAAPKKGGRRFCYFDGNVAVIVWLHEKLGQPNHIDMLGIARASGSDHFDLYGWYNFWHHIVGKCIAPGCVARLPT
jgi:serine/threonine-protein kinase